LNICKACKITAQNRNIYIFILYIVIVIYNIFILQLMKINWLTRICDTIIEFDFACKNFYLNVELHLTYKTLIKWINIFKWSIFQKLDGSKSELTSIGSDSAQRTRLTYVISSLNRSGCNRAYVCVYVCVRACVRVCVCVCVYIYMLDLSFRELMATQSRLKEAMGRDEI